MRTPRHAFLTGASSGIGAALARELSNRGASLTLAARRRERLEQLADDLCRAGGTVRIVELDVREPGDVAAAVQQADEHFGGLDLVVANAGVGLADRATELTWEQIDQTLAVNVRGAFATLHAGLRCMLPRRRGALCGISSLASLGGMPKSGAYSASKAALSTFLETLRLDLAGTGLGVVDVQPGYVVSEMTGGGTAHPVLRGRSMVPTEDAARWIADGIAEGRPVISFPRSESVPLRLLRTAPSGVWRRVMGRLSDLK